MLQVAFLVLGCTRKLIYCFESLQLGSQADSKSLVNSRVVLTYYTYLNAGTDSKNNPSYFLFKYCYLKIKELYLHFQQKTLVEFLNLK